MKITWEESNSEHVLCCVTSSQRSTTFMQLVFPQLLDLPWPVTAVSFRLFSRVYYTSICYWSSFSLWKRGRSYLGAVIQVWCLRTYHIKQMKISFICFPLMRVYQFSLKLILNHFDHSMMVWFELEIHLFNNRYL